jgi:two-component system, NtrC family, response regulator HydG
MTRSRLLVLDPDVARRGELRLGLGERGFEVAEARSLEEALPAQPGFAPEVVLARVRAPGDGEELLRALAAHGCDAAVVAVASLEGLDAAVAAMRAGAESYLLAPVAPSQAAVALDKVLEKRRLRREGAALRDELRRRQVMVGQSPQVLAAHELIRRVGPTKATVLVLGESGTGRELCAQLVHEASPRRARPFVRVSCVAVSEPLLERELFGQEPGAFAEDGGRRVGRIEAADGGTLLLHEVSRLPPGLQVRLLRVLQQGELERVGGREAVRVDVRVVASSTRDLAEEVRAGRFRDDLYYRLAVVAVQLPALRDRKGDLPVLVEHLLGRGGTGRRRHRARRLSPGALSALCAHHWPGNVRELETVLARAAAACDGAEIGTDHLPPVLHAARPAARAASALIPGATLLEIEREAILRTLEEVEGSTVRAAEVLGVSVRKIQYRLKEYRAGHVEGWRAAG